MAEGLIEFHKAGAAIVGAITVENLLDVLSLEEFSEECMKTVDKNPNGFFILNFERVDFLSSAALSELIKIHKAAEDAGVTFQLCGVSEDILRVFTVTNLNKILTITGGDAKSAIAKFSRSAERAGNEAKWKDK